MPFSSQNKLEIFDAWVVLLQYAKCLTGSRVVVCYLVISAVVAVRQGVYVVHDWANAVLAAANVLLLDRAQVAGLSVLKVNGNHHRRRCSDVS